MCGGFLLCLDRGCERQEKQFTRCRLPQAKLWQPEAADEAQSTIGKATCWVPRAMFDILPSLTTEDPSGSLDVSLCWFCLAEQNFNGSRASGNLHSRKLNYDWKT